LPIPPAINLSYSRQKLPQHRSDSTALEITVFGELDPMD
jgi:hypothetical protein